MMARKKTTDVVGEEHELQDWVLNEILDHMNANIYVTDPETGEILFMNRAMKKAFGLESYRGAKCWEVLQNGLHERCAFCPISRLGGAPGENPAYVWEEHNSRNGRYYRNYDSLMRWFDGRIVHFQHSVDVTEERRMRLAANYDELTGVLNRRAGKEILQQKLARGEIFALCILDVNGLKIVNDTRGHQAGDALLIDVVDAVRGGLSERDCIFRLSGDEFVVLLDGKNGADAAALMETALKVLRAPQDAEDRFCYGVAETTEGAERTAAGLFASADAQLYRAKRQTHIRRAERKLAVGAAAADGGEFAIDGRMLYQALSESTDEYLYVCDMKSDVFLYPQSMVDDFDLPGRLIANAAAVWGAKVHERDRALFLESNQDIAEGRTDVHCVEYRAQNRKGEWQWMRCRGRLIRDERGEPVLFAGFIGNLGKKDQIDHLTGLFNKIAFRSECERLLGYGGVTLMIFGIDDLKRINSLYNREFGDEVVRMVSQRIQTYLPAGARVYRLDGDEFGVLLRGADRAAARACFDAVQEAFSAQQSFDGKKFFCTLSCGCATSPDGGIGYQELRKRTSCALDYAKRSGKNRIEFYSPDALASMERDFLLTERLRESIEKNYEGFRLVFQPIFDHRRRLRGAEALCRWTTPEFGEVAPAEFIPLLEKSGLMLRVGKWILRQAARYCAEYLRRDPSFTLNVNLSWLQMEDPALPEYLERILREYDVPHDRFVLELTESCLARNFERMSALFERLRGAGFRTAMDDFGTGYSSLGLLRQTPIDEVKLDMTFVRGIQESSFNQAFIRMAVELCHILGIRVCLEGVETENEYDCVRALGLDYLQGYLLGKPCESSELIACFLGSN